MPIVVAVISGFVSWLLFYGTIDIPRDQVNCGSKGGFNAGAYCVQSIKVTPR